MQLSARFLTAMLLIGCGAFSGTVAVAQDAVVDEPLLDAPAELAPPAVTPAKAKPQKPAPQFVLLLSSKAAPTRVQKVSEVWQTIERRVPPPSRRIVRTSRKAKSPEGVVHVFCQGATVATDLKGATLDYKIECTGKLRLVKGSTTITCSGLKYEAGFLVLSDVTIKDQGNGDGSFMEMQAAQLKVKYPVAFVSMQRAEPVKAKAAKPKTTPKPVPDDEFEGFDDDPGFTQAF